jgi:hypothetical protein
VAIAVMNRVWKHSRAKNSARLVLLAIADCCHNDDGTGAWPSMAALVAKTNLSLRAVQVAIRDLEKLNELKIKRNAGSAGQHVYAVLVRDNAESAPPQNLHPAESAPPADSSRTSADSASENAGSAPGTIRNHQNHQSRSTGAGARAQTSEGPRSTILGNSLLDEHVKACPIKPPRDVQRRAGEAIDRLLDEGLEAERIRAGLALMRARPRTGPGLLADLVHEAATVTQLPATGTDGRYARGSGSELPPRDSYDPKKFI